MSRQKRQTKTRSKQKTGVSPIMIIVVALAAVMLVVGLIVLGNQNTRANSGPVDTSQFPTLGKPDAPVTIIEYSDYG